MKSVSFSDLRNSSDMINRSDQVTNSMDSNIKRSSSYKNLTYYSSSEDILKRFSSKTTELKNSKELFKTDESHYQMNNFKENTSPEKVKEISTFEKQREKYQDVKTTLTESTIQDLKAIIEDQEKTIAELKETNVDLKNESDKNIEEIKFQENRIKYLEHMLAAFNTNSQDPPKPTSSKNEDNFSSGLANTFSSSSQGVSRGKTTFDRNFVTDSGKCSNVNYARELDNGCNEISTDLKIRPSSADSSLNNNFKYSDYPQQKDKRNQFQQYPTRTYTSDTEERIDNIPRYDSGSTQKMIQTDYVNRQRQKWDRDRSSNLTDFKSRLDEFTKYAKRSAEQNSLNQQTFTTPSTYDLKSSKKFVGVTDHSAEPLHKVRSRGPIQATDSRPPIDPFYKQRRPIPSDNKTNYERVAQNSKGQDLTSDDDEHLKERVQKILEKHNYPAPAYRNENPRKTSEFSYKGSNDYYNTVPTNATNSRSYERNTTDARYGYHSRDLLDAKNDSNIPRLDLTLYTDASTNDLITKYLNYQGSTNVS